MSTLELTDPLALRRALGDWGVVYQPVTSAHDGSSHWQRVVAEMPPPEGFFRAPPAESVKPFVLPSREPLYYFTDQGFQAQRPDLEPLVLFGVAACDLAALAATDRFYADDPWYQARRTALLLVGIDCARPCEGGFCSQVKSGPNVVDGLADLILVPPAEPGHSSGWGLIVGSDRGRDAINSLRLSPAGDDLTALRQSRQAEIATQQASRTIPLAMARVNGGDVTAEEWGEIAQQCLTCSGCTSVCPTCTCHAPVEVPLPDGDSRRDRCWDSCLYEGFQREASGHNPAFEAGQRVERFWFHKFSTRFESEYGRIGCVGCGRCESVCPGVIGVHSVARRLGGE